MRIGLFEKYVFESIYQVLTLNVDSHRVRVRVRVGLWLGIGITLRMRGVLAF